MVAAMDILAMVPPLAMEPTMVRAVLIPVILPLFMAGTDRVGPQVAGTCTVVGTFTTDAIIQGHTYTVDSQVVD